MKNKLNNRILLLTGFMVLLSGLQGFSQGFLKADGKKIVNEKGENIILRGMGLGGWMLQEGYMFHISNLGRQYRIKEEITKLVGEQKANEFYDLWLKNHTTKADIDSLASWGFNSVRLPMHYALYTPAVENEPVAGKNTWLKKGFDITDSLLAWCKTNRMYLILDLHATPGGQGNDLNISDRNPDKPSLWESEANQQKMVALWRKLAEKYKDEPWIGGYDIINEPNWGFESKEDFRGTAEKTNVPLRKLMVEITKAIREVDKKHIIIIEGNGFGNNYAGIFPKWDDNMVLSFHKYGNFNNTKAIQQFLEYRKEQNMPIWLGESGENSNTWFAEAINLMESNNIGWAWWQLKKIGINNPLEIKAPEGYQKLLAYWNGKGEKPSADEAWKILQQFVANTRIENTVYHPDVIDAMFRQVKDRTARPYRANIIKKGTTINAVDYDLGAQRIAYFDTDTASYQYTPGVNTRGNRGRSYRNDGVDIKTNDIGEPYIFDIEDGEWLNYTLNVQEAGTYNVSAKLFSAKVATVTLINGTESTSTEIKAGLPEYWVPLGKFNFKQGKNSVKIKADVGGFNFYQLKFE
ncbi:MAG TPA: cellulase family glycosylhydrolase [Pelobium sp.]|nr:cellulase family glycosylhydrolase [Pelobium sp.]